MARRAQTQLIVSELTRQRGTALALATGEARAEIWRKLIEDALPRMEAAYSAQLAELTEVAERMGMTPGQLAEKATADRYTIADLRDRKRYPRKA